MKENEAPHPPHWPRKFLRALLKKEYLEEIEGDMEETFYENVQLHSLRKANRLYTREMIKLLRPVLLRNLNPPSPLNQYGMFKNYFKVSIRGLMKYPLSSSINLFGLAFAIAFCVFAYAFASWTYNRDQFHENKDVVFLSTFFAAREGTMQQFGQSPRPMADVLKEEFPQVKDVCRIEDRYAIVKHHDHVFNERIRFADPAFLRMLTFPLKWGSATTLSDPSSIILSEQMAIKYFGEENPIGQTLLLKLNNRHSTEFKVTGVAKQFPSARSFAFNFLINFENLQTFDPAYDPHDWTSFVAATFIQFSDPADASIIERAMDKYIRLQNEAVADEWKINAFSLESLATMHLKSHAIRDDIFGDGSSSNIKSIGFLTVVCVLMITLACFNYMNIAIASAAKRLKELGVRKSIGASRRTIIVQFLSENIITTLFALVLGLTLARFIVIPWFENLWTFDMEFGFTDLRLWVYLLVILLTTGLASGIYPSIYISSFKAVSILKGSVKFGQSNPVTKVFLGFQLVLACVFITSAVMFTQNTDYLANRSWGYSNRDVLYAVLPDAVSLEQLKTTMERDPSVVALSGGADHIGKKHQSAVLHFPDRALESNLLEVDATYFSTMGIQLKHGRFFHDHTGSDSHAVVINETMANNLAMDHPVGVQFRIDSLQYEVVGVASDFHSYSFESQLKPTIFRVADNSDLRYLALKVVPGSERQSYASLKRAWSTLFPELPFNGGHQEDVWGNYYTEIGIHSHVWRVFATVAVLLAGLGLYGLVALNVSGRHREFSIRKVLGATLKNISTNIISQYSILFAAAILIGAPLSYFSIQTVLDFAYIYHMPVTVWSIIISTTILVAVLFGTMLTQVIKVSQQNPVSGLKME